MNIVEIYTRPTCPFFHRAKDLLNAKGVNFREIDISGNPARVSEMIHRSESLTVPQIFINQHHVGGSDDLLAADEDGTLAVLLGHSTQHPETSISHNIS